MKHSDDDDDDNNNDDNVDDDDKIIMIIYLRIAFGSKKKEIALGSCDEGRCSIR